MVANARESIEWPDAELERLEDCPVCATSLDDAGLDGLADPLRPDDPAVWRLLRCPTCDCLSLSPRPTTASIGRAYSEYFTHGPPAAPTDPTGPIAGARRQVRDGEWRNAYGYGAAGGVGALARVLSQAPWVRAAAARTIRSIPAPGPGMRLLDVGCANGEYLLQMKALGWAVEGIETDPIARAHAEAAGIPVRGGLLDASVESESFDAITLGHVIEHVHDPAGFLGECFRVLRPGGTLWLATPNVHARGLREFGRAYVQLDPPRHLTLFSRPAMKSLLGRVGFVDVGEEGAVPQASAWTYPRSHAVRSGMGSHPEVLPALPIRLRAKALAADVRAHFSPRRAEEIVMTARKPPRDD